MKRYRIKKDFISPTITIRAGVYKYDEIVKMANDKFSKIEEAYMRSDLRNKIDFEFASTFQVNILRNYIENYELMKGLS